MDDAASRLVGPRAPLTDASGLPARPGLYALWAADGTAQEILGLSEDGASRPLYVGKATDIRRRVDSYLSNARGDFKSFREYVRRALLTASHVCVAEWVLFGAGVEGMRHAIPGVDLGAKPLLAFDSHTREGFNAWLASHVTVSSVVTKDADALEGPVIRFLLPVMNKHHMAATRFSPVDASNWTENAFVGQLAWDFAAGGIDQLCRDASLRRRAAKGSLYFLCEAGEVSYRNERPDAGPDDLAFRWILDPTDEEQRERSVAAMHAWADGDYGTPDELLDRLGEFAWAPGFIHRFFGEECPRAPILTTPLRHLA